MNEHLDTIEGRCPSCGQWALFTSIGEQRWPESVSRVTGLPRVVRLYLCGNCNSTISHHTLES